MNRLRVGLLLNPVAGIGGAVALKGSDEAALRAQAESRGGTYQASARAVEFLRHASAHCPNLAQNTHWLTVAAPMGVQCFAQGAWSVEVIDYHPGEPTSAADTRAAARLLLARGVDLLIFVGGDGTARDVLTAIARQVPVLGIPAGVKMHSGVFAVTPRTAGLLLAQLVQGGLVATVVREVRDYDEAAPATEMRIRSYGELCVPEAGGYLQQTKIGGKESEPLAVEDICAYVEELLPDNRDLVIGPGSTCLAIKSALGIQGTLRGVDLVSRGGQVSQDVTAADLEQLPAPFVIVSFSRGQGFLFGRGNQQFSARFLARLAWPEDVLVVGTRTKLATLEQRPLLLDTGDAELDERLSGLVSLVSGYEDRLLYRLAAVAH